MIPVEIVDLAELFHWGQEELGARDEPYGEQFALRLPEVERVARAEHVSRHEWIVRRTIVGLWAERLRSPVVAVYTLVDVGEPLAIVSLGTRGGGRFGRLCEIFEEDDVLFECGRGFASRSSRPIVLWKPASNMQWLWPPYMDGIDGTGPLAMDTQAVDNFPYDITKDDAAELRRSGGRDGHVLLFPEEELGRFQFQDRDYVYANRIIGLPRRK